MQRYPGNYHGRHNGGPSGYGYSGNDGNDGTSSEEESGGEEDALFTNKKETEETKVEPVKEEVQKTTIQIETSSVLPGKRLEPEKRNK